MLLQILLPKFMKTALCACTHVYELFTNFEYSMKVLMFIGIILLSALNTKTVNKSVGNNFTTNPRRPRK